MGGVETNNNQTNKINKKAPRRLVAFTSQSYRYESKTVEATRSGVEQLSSADELSRIAMRLDQRID